MIGHPRDYASRVVAAVAALVLALCASGAARAQTALGKNSFGVGIIDAFDPAGDQQLVKLTAQFTAPTAERPAVLMITARIAPGWHVYAITQPPGGPQATRIRLTPSPQWRQIGPFRAFPPPKVHVEDAFGKGFEVMEHVGDVTWYAPIALSPGVDPAALEIEGTIDWQVCKETCIPQNAAIVARLGSGVPIGPVDRFTQPAETNPLPEPTYSGTYQAADSKVKFTGYVEPATVRPGQSARLVITASPSSGSHVFEYSPYDEKAGSKPTLITFESLSGLVPHRPATDAPLITDDSVPTFGTMRYYDGPVTWVTQIDVPADAPLGKYPIRGLIGYQACETSSDGRGSCEFARGIQFQATLQVSDSAGAGQSPLVFAAAKNYGDPALLAATWADAQPAAAAVAPAAATELTTADRESPGKRAAEAAPALRALDAYDLNRVRVDEEQSSDSLAYYLLLAFVGGMILNLMPCVLPVIGLKVMSFVQQAGKSRAHALVLNLWYAAGIIAVFLLLGLLAATLGLSWGGQFGSTAFNVVMASIVFAMALSLLGVWEVPIPGFFGRGTAQELATKEGPTGAFAKGVVTTILATPCTAPFMATAIAWAVTQPLATTLSVFASLGVGMASPYLVVGVFPELLRFLPKPGPWMETFKQITGFILLATVVFILSFMEPAAVVPTTALLIGIGMACWLVARVSPAADWNELLRTYALASAVIVLFAAVSFAWLHPRLQPRFAGLVARTEVDGQWQPFSLEKLKQTAVDAGRTVLVDFSADWCASCKVLEAAVLHTAPVEQAIAAAGAVTMYADYTHYPPEIDKTIRALRANGVPVIAVFPGDRPYEPIVFRGGYTKNDLIDALEKATGRRLRTGTGVVAEAAAPAAPLN